MDTTRLRSLIDESAKTQKEIAADLGLSQQRFNYYVNGQREPDIATVKQLAIYFNVSIDFLFGLTDDPYFPGRPLAEFIRIRRGKESEESFAQRCKIGVDLLKRIECGFRFVDEGDKQNQINSLSTEDMRNIAKALTTDWKHIAALYDRYDPRRIQSNFYLPDDAQELAAAYMNFKSTGEKNMVRRACGLEPIDESPTTVSAGKAV